MMSLILEQDVLINPHKQLGLETKHTMLRLSPPPAFLFPLLLLLMVLLLLSTTTKPRDTINTSGEVEGRVSGEMSAQQEMCFSFSLFLFQKELILLVLMPPARWLCKCLNEHVCWQKCSGNQGMIRLEY